MNRIGVHEELNVNSRTDRLCVYSVECIRAKTHFRLHGIRQVALQSSQC